MYKNFLLEAMHRMTFFAILSLALSAIFNSMAEIWIASTGSALELKKSAPPEQRMANTLHSWVDYLASDLIITIITEKCI